MRFTNVSGGEAAWAAGYEPDGRELLIVAIKFTYRLPANGSDPEPVAETGPLVQADTFSGEPGLSAPKYETDFAFRKPFCDVLLLGSAYVPDGKPARRVEVGLQVGGMVKQFVAVGNRVWMKGLAGISATAPSPFSILPIGYDVAYGGADRTFEASNGKVFTYASNPVGRGFWHETDDIEGKPLPNTEETTEPVTTYRGAYKPQAFSPVGRSWSPRVGYAGTYDQEWLDNECPFWPKNFDFRYFQAAAEDQWIAYPRGGEPIVLKNLTSDGYRAFHLPPGRVPVTFIPYRGFDVTRDAVLDTIVLEPDLDRFTLTWRASLALGKSLFDVEEVIAGEMSRGWHRARRLDKDYFPSLGALVAAKRGERPS